MSPLTDIREPWTSFIYLFIEQFYYWPNLQIKISGGTSIKYIRSKKLKLTKKLGNPCIACKYEMMWICTF